MKIERILVPVDFSECSRAALKYAVHFANRLGSSSIDVLHVWQPPLNIDPATRLRQEGGKEATLSEFIHSQAGQKMKEFLAELEQGGEFSVQGRLETGEPQETVLQVAEGYDLVVMGTQGESSKAKLGSIAQRVVRNAACPVLTIRISCE